MTGKNLLLRLSLGRSESTLEVVDSETGDILASQVMHNVSAERAFTQRNKLFEALSSEADSVETRTFDCRS